jgi:hypothetical protein
VHYAGSVNMLRGACSPRDLQPFDLAANCMCVVWEPGIIGWLAKGESDLPADKPAKR